MLQRFQQFIISCPRVRQLLRVLSALLVNPSTSATEYERRVENGAFLSVIAGKSRERYYDINVIINVREFYVIFVYTDR